MATFEKRVNYLIDFEKPILARYMTNELVSYSHKIFKNSVLAFNGYVRDSNTINIVFLHFIIDVDDREDFKNMTVSDVKNIIYNTIIEIEGGY